MKEILYKDEVMPFRGLESIQVASKRLMYLPREKQGSAQHGTPMGL